MNLNPDPFALIASGKKTIELRLYDAKRQLIKPDNIIIFSNTQTPTETLSDKKKKLHTFRSFAELYQALPLEQCGYRPEELANANPKDMDIYYSPARQAQYGVVGIEIELI